MAAPEQPEARIFEYQPPQSKPEPRERMKHALEDLLVIDGIETVLEQLKEHGLNRDERTEAANRVMRRLEEDSSKPAIRPVDEAFDDQA